MGCISSINFKKSTSFQVFHNSSIRPDYAIGGELAYTLKGYEALKLKEKIIAKAMQNYTQHIGQKFKAKSYEWSAVVNLKPESTMQDCENLAKFFKEKYGFQCYQIAIHRDEGYINEQGEKIINHHAHLEFVTLDRKTGKNNYRRELITPSVLRQMQTEVAEILQMERGQDKRLTGAKRIEPRAYAKMKEEERKNNLELKHSLEIEKARIISKALENANERLEQNFLSTKEIKDILEAFRKQSIGKGLSKEFFRELSDKKKNTKEATKEELELFCSDLLRAYEIKNEKLNERDFKINSLESDLRHTQQKNDELLKEIDEMIFRGISERLKAYNETIEKLQKENRNILQILDKCLKPYDTFGEFNRLSVEEKLLKLLEIKNKEYAQQSANIESKKEIIRKLQEQQKPTEYFKDKLKSFENTQSNTKTLKNDFER